MPTITESIRRPSLAQTTGISDFSVFFRPPKRKKKPRPPERINSDDLRSIITGARRRKRRPSLVATGPSGVRKLGLPPRITAAVREPEETLPDNQYQGLMRLSTDLQALTAGMRGRARGNRYTPPALLNMLQGPAATASPLTEDPVRAQRHMPAGRYSRPLGTVGVGARAALQEEQDREAANRQLGEAMRANRPLSTEQRIARSNLPGERFGANLGRFSERFQGTLGEFTQANIDYRDALAQGEEGVRPGSFQGLESPSDPLAAEMAEQEEVAAGRREKRRDEFAGSFVPKEIRQRLVTAKKQGRRITPLQAMIEKRVEAGQAVGPEGLMALFGELGQRESEGRRVAETAAADRQAALEANRQQILGMIMGAEGISPSAKRSAFSELIRGRGQRRAFSAGLAAEGGAYGLIAPDETETAATPLPAMDVAEIEKKAEGDAEAFRLDMEANGASQGQIDRETRKRFPDAGKGWQQRLLEGIGLYGKDDPIGMASAIGQLWGGPPPDVGAGAGSTSRKWILEMEKRARNGDEEAIEWVKQHRERLRDLIGYRKKYQPRRFSAVNKSRVADFIKKAFTPKPPRKPPKPPRKRTPPSGPSASFPYPG